jgi:hypothetical protein
MSAEFLISLILGLFLGGLSARVIRLLIRRNLAAKVSRLIGDAPLESLTDTQLLNLVETLPLGHPSAREALKIMLERNRRFRDEIWERVKYSTNLN